MADTKETLQSSQSFVRALKANVDPPQKNGPTKIQIARAGWEAHNFYVPRKAGLILEWIFTRFHKEKSKPNSENPLLDVNHWKLLADVLSNPSDTHIEPLIVRASVPSLVAVFLTLSLSLSPSSRDTLLGPVVRSLALLWPIATQRAGLDPLLECLSPALSTASGLGQDIATNGQVVILNHIFSGISTSFQNANTAGKKKAYTILSQHQFMPWLHALHHIPSSNPLHHLLYSTGTDILYSPDSLRAVLENNPNSNTSHDIFSTVFTYSETYDYVSGCSFLEALPELYKTFILALRKHRSFIFTGTLHGQPARERIREVALRFGNACLSFLRDMTFEGGLELVWKAKIRVLRLTEDERLYNTKEGEGGREMKLLGEDALKELDGAWDVSRVALVSHALDTLSCLHNIEPELVVQILPRVLERLVTAVPALERPALAFLRQLTSYHSKTRTLNILASYLLTTFASSLQVLPFSSPRVMYQKCMHSPLLSMIFADELVSAFQAFATPGQAEETIKLVIQILEESIRACNIDEPSRKRRKITPEKDQSMTLAVDDTSVAFNVVRFALVARSVPAVLAGVFYNTTGKDGLTRKLGCLASLDNLVAEALESLIHTESHATTGNVKNRTKRTRTTAVSDDGQWIRECLCSALLGLWYELFTERELLDSGIAVWHAPQVIDRLSGELIAFMHEDSLPELHVEISRVLYSRGGSVQPVTATSAPWPALDVILDYIESSGIIGGLEATLSTMHQDSTQCVSKRQGALKLWSLTLERYLSVIDLHASQLQLDRLVNLMLLVRPDISPDETDQEITAKSILWRAFNSAGFWELENLRTSLLSVLDQRTSVFKTMEPLSWLAAIPLKDSKTLVALSEKSQMSMKDIDVATEVYLLLHYIPQEYLSRSLRIELASRSLRADIFLRALNCNGELGEQSLVYKSTLFRSFVVMTAKQTQIQAIEEMVSHLWMVYLTLPSYETSGPEHLYIKVTLDLLSLIQVSAARMAIKAEESSLVNVLEYFLQSNAYTMNNTTLDSVTHQSLLRFARILVREFSVSSFPESCLSLLRQLCDGLQGSLEPLMKTSTMTSVSTEFIDSKHIIEAWQTLIELRRWLSQGSYESSLHRFGGPLLEKAAQKIKADFSGSSLISGEFRATILGLLVAEGQDTLTSDHEPVSRLTAAYVLFVASLPQAQAVCDIPMARACRLFSVERYQTALELVSEALGSGPNEEPQSIALLHLSTIFLREAPERTSKLSYEHASQCLRIFINRPTFMDCSSKLMAQVLDFVQCQCTERAALLKASDASCILLIFSKLLVGSKHHDEHTSASIFRSIVYIANALIRLRRDLLGPYLPQLSMLLRQLISAVRGVRPLLGIKQHRTAADTFPKWINPIDPLGEEEARALARLLTAIATKSIVRTHVSYEQHKLESLARPFARHAPYVLLAYLRNLNDPLSVLSSNIRRELEPGLFALCTMMGEHGRDTLMVQSLDIGGKALLKSLWKEYSKQRYAGRG